MPIAPRINRCSRTPQSKTNHNCKIDEPRKLNPARRHLSEIELGAQAAKRVGDPRRKPQEPGRNIGPKKCGNGQNCDSQDISAGLVARVRCSKK